MQAFPEVDRAGWFGLEAAARQAQPRERPSWTACASARAVRAPDRDRARTGL